MAGLLIKTGLSNLRLGIGYPVNKIMVDVYSFCLLVSKEVNGKRDNLRKMKTVRKLQLTSPSEATILATFQAPVPALFTKSGKGKVCGKNKSAFSHFAKSSSWTMEGCDRISRAITTLGSGLQRLIGTD